MEKEIKLVLIPILLIVIGVLFNTLVVALNHGMPIIENNYQAASPFVLNEKYVALSNDTILPFLADVIKVGDYIFAIGDLLIWAGLIVCIGMLIYNLKIKQKSLTL